MYVRVPGPASICLTSTHEVGLLSLFRMKIKQCEHRSDQARAEQRYLVCTDNVELAIIPETLQLNGTT